MLPLPNSKTNKNTGQNCSTYSFTITKNKKQTLQSFPSLILVVLTGEQGFQASALVSNGGKERGLLVFLFFLTCFGIAAHIEER